MANVESVDLKDIPGLIVDSRQMMSAWTSFFSGLSKDGRIVGKGVLFGLPTNIKVDGCDQDLKKITLSCKGMKFEFQAHGLAVPKYRKQVTFVELVDKNDHVFSFRSFAYMNPTLVGILSGVSKKMQQKQSKCLTKAEFDWVTQTVSKSNKPMTDGPRRWREIRNEFGFSVRVENGEYCCEDASVPTFEPNVRPDTSALTRDLLQQVASGSSYRCAKCNSAVSFSKDADVPKGVLDHRRPVFYGGTDVIENLQIFCVACNNLKRKACEQCFLRHNCSICSWAYPEKLTDTILIRLAPQEVELFRKILAKHTGSPPEIAKMLLLEAMNRFLEKDT